MAHARLRNTALGPLHLQLSAFLHTVARGAADAVSASVCENSGTPMRVPTITAGAATNPTAAQVRDE